MSGSEGSNGVVIASLSHVGRVRAANEDHCDEFRASGGEELLVVADGMGGHRGGATASRLAVRTIGEVFDDDGPKDEALLARAIGIANERVLEKARNTPELRGMGTTVVMVLLAGGGRGWVAHVGDSRAYRLRDGRLDPLTEDHSVVAAMVREGLLTTEQAAVHPRRNEILRSVGVDAAVEPEIRALEILPGDRYLLCSDGLSGLIDDDEIAAVLRSEPPAEAVRTLVDAANDRGGMDNITVQIAAIPGGDTTEVGRDGVPRGGTWTRKDEIEPDRRLGVQRTALWVALLAGLVAAAMLYYALAPRSAAASERRVDGRGGDAASEPEPVGG